MRFRPSSSHRWLNCPGSLILEQFCQEQEESEYAAEGTAAHSLIEACFAMSLYPSDLLGSKLQGGFEVTQDMVSAVDEFFRYLDSEIPSVVTEYSELHIDGSEIMPGFSGTIDYLAIDEEAKTGYVVDYKHGVGVSIDADDNPQLMCYAALASLEAADVDRWIVAIIQPRAFEGPTVRQIEIHAQGQGELYGLNQFINHIQKAAALVNRIDELQGDDLKEHKDILLDHLATGSHCQFCRAKATCPAQLKQNVELITQEQIQFNLPAPGTLRPEVIVELIKHEKQISSWLDALKEFAKGQLQIGNEIDGLKLVKSWGHRQWSLAPDEVAKKLRALLRAKQLKKADLFEPAKMLSPAKVEKLLGKGSVDDLTQKPDRGERLALASARGQPVNSTSKALEDFSDVEVQS